MAPREGTVFVVDDQDDTCLLVSQVLQLRGAAVTTAGSVDEAIQRLDGSAFDVLVSDIAMPVRDGFDLIRHVRTHQNGLPAIALTAYSRTKDRVQALAAGFQLHVPKPENAAELAHAIASIVGRFSPG